MDLRSIKPGIRAAHEAGTGIFHPTLRHPVTGEPLEAVGVGKNGNIWWPVLGGAEEGGDGDGDGGNDDGEGDNDGDNDDNDGDNSDDDDDDDDEKDPKKKIAALEEEKDRHFKRRKKAEKERDELKAELEALKAKKEKAAKKSKKAEETDDDDEDDDDDEESPAARRQREADEAEKRKLKVENAFLRTNTIEWHNPGQVMTLLLGDDDYEVEFDDRGNIDRQSLKAELKRFAKANPHLVKKKDSSKGSDDGNDSKSGSAMNGTRKGKGQQPPTREALAKKYPALGRRP